MSLVTGCLLMTQRSSRCRISTGAGQQPLLRRQRDSGMTIKIFNIYIHISFHSSFHLVLITSSCFLYFHIFLICSCSKLQSYLLQQQTFLEKCETWMEFLVQTEENLAVEISGNYQSLMEQQRTHEVGVPYITLNLAT